MNISKNGRKQCMNEEWYKTMYEHFEEWYKTMYEHFEEWYKTMYEHFEELHNV